MRRLIYVPIVHAEADMGSLTHSLRKKYIERLGLWGWRRHTQSLEVLWEEIRKRVLALEIDFHNLKVYQDGLPICGRELEIIRELAQQGSKNHLLLVELAERGATIMGTEDAQLLVEEYLRLRDGFATNDEKGHRVTFPSDDLLHRRDLHMAKRIRETLAEGETGILFVGLLHRVDEMLGEDTEINYLFKKGEEVKSAPRCVPCGENKK